jgi:hypothetical protein
MMLFVSCLRWLGWLCIVEHLHNGLRHMLPLRLCEPLHITQNLHTRQNYYLQSELLPEHIVKMLPYSLL